MDLARTVDYRAALKPSFIDVLPSAPPITTCRPTARQEKTTDVNESVGGLAWIGWQVRVVGLSTATHGKGTSHVGARAGGVTVFTRRRRRLQLKPSAVLRHAVPRRLFAAAALFHPLHPASTALPLHSGMTS